VIQAPEAQAAPPAPVKQEPIPDAVMLEWRGNRWVKVSSFETPLAASGEAVKSPSNSGAAPAPVPAKEIPPAVLVYRDGHSEELSSYSIIGNTIYAKANYWSSGAWTRKIQVADLDVPATLERNHARGVPFQLPSGPNEIELRP
jgi:hypothetical protein